MRYLPVIIPLALTLYAAVDCLRTPDDQVKHLPKPIWLVLVLLVWVAGPIIWLVAGRERGLARPAERRPIAPDDDPEFLRRLGKNRPDQRNDRNQHDQQGDGQP